MITTLESNISFFTGVQANIILQTHFPIHIDSEQFYPDAVSVVRIKIMENNINMQQNAAQTGKAILMVLTSHAQMKDAESKTGVWLGEFTDPYYEFIDAGYQVTLASPQGGKPPIDPMSELTENITGANRRFKDDDTAKSAFEHTQVLSQIKAADYDAIFYPGGHGPLWDLAADRDSAQLILDFYHAGKPVGAVCHGPAAFIKVAELEPGFLLGKNISAFTNTEETLVGRADDIPYQLETRLKDLGAEFYAAMVPFMSHVEIDGLLVTGQNPLSAGPTAKALIKMLG